jgi:hypothetical protein
MRFEEDDIGGCGRRGHVTTTLCEYGVVLSDVVFNVPGEPERGRLHCP